jgi:hypothetical protein
MRQINRPQLILCHFCARKKIQNELLKLINDEGVGADGFCDKEKNPNIYIYIYICASSI